MSGTQTKHRMGTKQVSELTGVSQRVLQIWAKTKDRGPPFKRYGNRYIYTKDEVENWVESLYGRPPDARA